MKFKYLLIILFVKKPIIDTLLGDEKVNFSLWIAKKKKIM